ncbi:MAG: cob(I)yrinic acid a,c-diamide adenosyltransferase [Roseiarcus sp.]
MVKLNVIYTRTGDKGETGLGDGSRRQKSDARVAAMGDVDEANCAIGLALLAVRNASDAADLAIEPALARIQNDLFDLGADLCLPRQADEKPGAVLRVAPSQVQALEHAIDTLNGRLHPLRSFVLPGGTAASAALHLARAVCRRAERAMVALAAIEGEEVTEAALAYVNRLSDYLFVAARAANDFGKSDVLWAPGANQSESPDQPEDDER